jgi:hypothetical protein
MRIAILGAVALLLLMMSLHPAKRQLCGAMCTNPYKRCGGECTIKQGHLRPHRCGWCHSQWALSYRELAAACLARQQARLSRK